MKKFVTFLIFILCFATLLTGCGVSGGQGGESEDSANVTQKTPDSEEITTANETEEETMEETVPATKYYVTAYPDDIQRELYGVYDSYEEAVEICGKVSVAVKGHRVCDENGQVLYYPLTELQCDIMREAKYVTDYVRENKFTYGDAPINPAINHKAKKVSCDRLCCWVLYRVGFTDQPRTQGLVVSNICQWCEKHGFEKITKVEDLQPGDIVCVNPAEGGKYPGHVFICGGLRRDYNGTDRDIFYRYDCGSDQRIQSKQPFSEVIANFMYAYRPVKQG